eukprot:scaffold16108_cov61-Phaeocystis_antarctica.AAC.9
MAKKDAGGFYGYITASPFIAVATVFMGFITQVYVLNASRSVNCQSLIYLLHYRATILFGLWCTGALCFATEASTCAIIGRQQRVRSPDSSRAIINEDAPVPARQRRVEVGAWHWCSACSRRRHPPLLLPPHRRANSRLCICLPRHGPVLRERLRGVRGINLYGV